MESSRKYYKDINFIRLLACAAVLLYHLNILKGGYLAVCIFFALSGYLSCISAFKTKEFSLSSYYSKLILRLYLPLVVVVFITIAVISFFPNINWLNLKPESTSVLFGYNNFWQLSANLDYFARQISSPFMHLWYIAILFQFDLIFPFIYMLLRKIGDKISKIIPCIITIILSIVSFMYFYKLNLDQNIMASYYNTFARSFSLLFGLSLGFIHSYYRPIMPKILTNKIINRIIFYLYILISIFLLIFIDANSKYFVVTMLLITLITCRLIDYASVNKEKINKFDMFIKYLSGMTYEIYLFQYPVIYLFQYINIDFYLKIPIIIIIVLLLSFILHFCTNFKSKNYNEIRCLVAAFLVCISLYGVYQYFLAKDHTQEMKNLEQQLESNEKMIEQKQKEYAEQMKQEEDDWNKVLSDLENDESKVKEIVNNLPVVGVGDSVMLGAVEDLYKQFPNSYFDAKISRSAWVANGILQDLKNRNLLGDPIVINLGANGDCTTACKKAIIETCKDRDLFWLTVTNDKDVHVNDKLISLAKEYPNMHIIDWNSISSGHPEYFFSDGIHLTLKGRQVYTKAIYDSIYKVYLEEYKNKIQSIIDDHENEKKSKITFYGNDILLNAFDDLQNNFKTAKFDISKDLNYETLKEKIENGIKDNSLNYNIVLAFDNSTNIDISQYKYLIELCKEHKIYIVCLDEKIFNELNKENYENVALINFQEEIQSDEYLMPDKLHLNEEGNKKLNSVLYDTISE